MKRIPILLALSILLTTGVAFADTMKMAPKVIKCPSCGMPMPTHKTAMMTAPIYIKALHKVYYCCPICPSGKAAAMYMKKHHKPESM
jgi:hypothetical protein